MPSKCILVTSKAITGYLNVDDVDGFGPQHSFANIINEPQIFKTKVCVFSYHTDRIVKCQLEAKVDGVSVWTETGTFDPALGDAWSAEIDVALSLSTCVHAFSSLIPEVVSFWMTAALQSNMRIVAFGACGCVMMLSDRRMRYGSSWPHMPTRECSK